MFPIIQRIYDRYAPVIEEEIEKITQQLAAGVEALQTAAVQTAREAQEDLAEVAAGAQELWNSNTGQRLREFAAFVPLFYADRFARNTGRYFKRMDGPSHLRALARNLESAGIGRPLTVQSGPGGEQALELLRAGIQTFVFPINILFSPMGTEHLAPYRQTLTYKPRKHTETFRRFPMSFDLGARAPRTEP